MRIHITTKDGEPVATLDVDKAWDIDSPTDMAAIREWVTAALQTAREKEKQS